MSIMMLEVLLVAGCVIRTASWPIETVQRNTPSVPTTLGIKCGDELDIPMSITDMMLISSLNLTLNGLFIPGCIVALRFGIEVDHQRLANYGLLVEGTLDVTGSSCTDSFLQIADQDDVNDNMGSSLNYCGTKTVYYSTTEDTVNVEFEVGALGASGKGFQLSVQPVYLCGGVIEGNSTLTSPYYPKPYPKNIVCLWNIKSYANTTAVLWCSVFDLPALKGSRCKEYVSILSRGKINVYCGKQLLNVQKTYNSLEVYFKFRAGDRQNPSLGFSCNLEYQQ